MDANLDLDPLKPDPLYKAFFSRGGLPPFLRAFYPALALVLDLDAARSRDKEQIGASSKDPIRLVDFLAEIPRFDSGPPVTVHLEFESHWRSVTRLRGFEYDFLLAGQVEGSLLSAVIYRNGGQLGIGQETVIVPRPDESADPVFKYSRDAFCFRKLSADLFLTPKCEPGIAALAAGMNRGLMSRPELKARVLPYLAPVKDKAWRDLLLQIAETGCPLKESEKGEFRRLLQGKPEYSEANAMITVYERDGIEKGLQQGLQTGLQQGLQQGLQTGLQQGKGETLIRQLRLKFGELPKGVADRIRTQGEAELDAYLDRVVTAATFDEMGLANGAR